MARAIYLTHPQVEIDPALPVTDWHLSKTGAARVAALVDSGALGSIRHIFSSHETKALETAFPIAEHLGLSPVIYDEMGENDRRSTGFLAPAEFEAVADQFFAAPMRSVRGWETAACAQNRIVQAVDTALQSRAEDACLFVGHGAVGTLLWCALSGVPISRAHDQGPGGGGNWFAFDTLTRLPESGWRPMEKLPGA